MRPLHFFLLHAERQRGVSLARIMHRLSRRSAAGAAMTRRVTRKRVPPGPRRRTHAVRRGAQGSTTQSARTILHFAQMKAGALQ